MATLVASGLSIFLERLSIADSINNMKTTATMKGISKGQAERLIEIGNHGGKFSAMYGKGFWASLNALERKGLVSSNEHGRHLTMDGWAVFYATQG